MADPNPQSEEKLRQDGPASSMQQDYFTILTNVISEASQDPTQLRKLVYALAWLKTEALLSEPSPKASQQVRTLLKLERSLELHAAIDQIEAIALQEPEKLSEEPQETRQPQAEDFTPQLPDRNPFAQDLDELARRRRSAPRSGSSVKPERVFHDNALIIPPERTPAWQQPGHEAFLTSELDHRVRAALNRLEREPRRQQHRTGPGLVSFFQLIAAVIGGVTLYVGVARWVHLSRDSRDVPTQIAASAPASQHAAAVAHASDATVQSQATPSPALPFPLPGAYGVYAVNGGQLIDLEQLPIKIPDARVLVSAEITQPSHAVLPTGDVAFVVFRRDLVNSAPPTASVRVVARVSRAMTFVDGKPGYTALEHSWRIRAKSYDFKVSPIEGQREMILIQPTTGMVLPAGRYALALNGYGYDFTIAGKVTSSDQCLEQVEVLNGTVLSQCPKS